MGKPKYEKWLEKENLILLQGWARDGLSEEEIAHNMGINRSTLWEWKKNPDLSNISNALKNGKEVVDYAVENALMKNAMNGNIVAQIFWLKNRRPDKWRDKVEHEVHDDTLKNAESILIRMREAAEEDAGIIPDTETG